MLLGILLVIGWKEEESSDFLVLELDDVLKVALILLALIWPEEGFAMAPFPPFFTALLGAWVREWVRVLSGLRVASALEPWLDRLNLLFCYWRPKLLLGSCCFSCPRGWIFPALPSVAAWFRLYGSAFVLNLRFCLLQFRLIRAVCCRFWGYFAY
ncbi:hypothetical protein U1Q18_007546 [Sarracenia purpurea var. burkii]